MFVLPAAMLVGCANGAESSSVDRASLYKRHGAVQCGGPGAPLSATERQLKDAGIRVLGASCGNDGMARVAMCGAGSGSIHIVEVPKAQTQAAQALGFAPLSSLPDARKSDCR